MALRLNRRINGWALCLLPGLLFLIVVFVVPLAEMVRKSLVDPSPANYSAFFESDYYVASLVATFKVAFLVTGVTLVIGYAWALLMHRANRSLRAVLIAVVLIPFWSSLLVRTFSWTVILRPSGPINDLLLKVGLTDEPVALVGNLAGTVIGSVQVLLPFMVFPVYAIMARIDGDLERAAQSLGSPPLRVFRTIFLPLTMPGVIAGCVLVFVLTLGFFVTPALLGSAREPVLGQLIAEEVQQLRFGLVSAMGVILLLVTLVALAIGSRAASLGKVVGYHDG